MNDEEVRKLTVGDTLALKGLTVDAIVTVTEIVEQGGRPVVVFMLNGAEGTCTGGFIDHVVKRATAKPVWWAKLMA